MVVKNPMKINGRGEAGYSQAELVHAFRANPDLNFQPVQCTDAQQHNQAVTELFSELSELKLWQDSPLDLAWHQQQQSQWRMPAEYQKLDIARLLLDRCEDQAELQRMATELLMFQECDLMPLLCYLHYLVETLRAAGVVLGVGRGSSVASFALYKLGVHRVNSLYWDLDIAEFLKPQGEINV
jgi:DNA polymerase III alpha subunit